MRTYVQLYEYVAGPTKCQTEIWISRRIRDESADLAMPCLLCTYGCAYLSSHTYIHTCTRTVLDWRMPDPGNNSREDLGGALHHRVVVELASSLADQFKCAFTVRISAYERLT